MRKIQRGFDKFKSLIPIYGYWGAITQILRNILLIEVSVRFEKDLRTPEEKVIPKIPLDIIPVQGEADLNKWGIREALFQIRGSYGVEQAEDRLKEGYVLFCAISEEKLAGFIWLNSFPVHGAGFKLKDDEAYHIDGWTFAPFRGKGVLPALQQGVFNYLRQYYPKIRTLIGHASAWNKASIIGQQRSGLILVARELSIVIFGFHRKFHLSKIK